MTRTDTAPRIESLAEDASRYGFQRGVFYETRDTQNEDSIARYGLHDPTDGSHDMPPAVPEEA